MTLETYKPCLLTYCVVEVKSCDVEAMAFDILEAPTAGAMRKPAFDSGTLFRIGADCELSISCDHQTSGPRGDIFALEQARSSSAVNPGLYIRTKRMPKWVPGENLRTSEKSRSCVTNNRPSRWAACQTVSSSLPQRPSSRTVTVSCPRERSRAANVTGMFSSSLIVMPARAAWAGGCPLSAETAAKAITARTASRDTDGNTGEEIEQVPPMSMTEILEELPRLRRVERERVWRRLEEIELETVEEPPEMLDAIDAGRRSICKGKSATIEQSRNLIAHWATKASAFSNPRFGIRRPCQERSGSRGTPSACSGARR